MKKVVGTFAPISYGEYEDAMQWYNNTIARLHLPKGDGGRLSFCIVEGELETEGRSLKGRFLFCHRPPKKWTLKKDIVNSVDYIWCCNPHLGDELSKSKHLFPSHEGKVRSSFSFGRLELWV